MIYEKVEVKDICKIKSGKRLPKGADFANEITNYPYIRARDIKNGIIDGSELVYLTEEVQKKIQKYIVNTNDIVITIVGASVGDVGFVKSEFDGFNLTENAVRLTDFDERVNPRFLLYILNSKKYWELMQQIAGGSAQPKLGIYKIESIPLELPPVKVQNKIVNILSDFDDLIENNKTQIKLLEEAAQRLYKEWFVDLRFPGHEDIAIVDGVPEGWEKDKAEKFFNITIGKTPPRAEKQWFVNGNDGVPWLSISDMGTSGVYSFTTSEGLTQEAVKKHNMKVVPAGTIFVSFKLTVGRVSIATTDMCTNEAIAHFYIDDDFKQAYTYCYLNNFEYDTLGNTSSISKAVNSKIIKAMPFVIPDEVTILAFDKLVAPILEEIKNKQMVCIKLKEARDRLLPKLMSGEIEV